MVSGLDCASICPLRWTCSHPSAGSSTQKHSKLQMSPRWFHHPTHRLYVRSGGCTWPRWYRRGDLQINLTFINICARSTHGLSLLGTTGIRHIINTTPYHLRLSSLRWEGVFSGYHIGNRWNLSLVPRTLHLWAPYFMGPLFDEPVSYADGRRTFQALLHVEPFRVINYEAAVQDDSIHQIPSTMPLQKSNLERNVGIFSCTKQIKH